MKHILKCQELSPEELKVEMKERTDLINKMVGTLYPSILWDEILTLRKLYIDKTGKYDY